MDPQAAEAAAIIDALRLPLGMIEVGTALGTFGFGIVRRYLYDLKVRVNQTLQVTCQTYTYYDRYPKDSLGIKLVVSGRRCPFCILRLFIKYVGWGCMVRVALQPKYRSS